MATLALTAQRGAGIVSTVLRVTMSMVNVYLGVPLGIQAASARSVRLHYELNAFEKKN